MEKKDFDIQKNMIQANDIQDFEGIPILNVDPDLWTGIDLINS